MTVESTTRDKPCFVHQFYIDSIHSYVVYGFIHIQHILYVNIILKYVFYLPIPLYLGGTTWIKSEAAKVASPPPGTFSLFSSPLSLYLLFALFQL
jgi:hypothetical protein